mmetsp:Transcript_17134/g.51412  ORF Transcript_17134/g.51412 Transcript_17134/m.51412 type:complete len:220 (-) Transcript_17134:879-1538(-)
MRQLLLLEEAQRVDGVDVMRVHTAARQQAVRWAAWHAVEVARDNHGDVGTSSNLLEALEQRVHLPQLDVVELRVGMDVCICDADERAACGSLGWSMLHGLQHRNQRHIVLEQPAERRLLLVLVLEALCKAQRRLVELHLVLLDQAEALALVKCRTPVNRILVVGVKLGRLLLVDVVIAGLGKLRRPELKVVALDLLQAHDVCLVGEQLSQQVALAVVPV